MADWLVGCLLLADDCTHGNSCQTGAAVAFTKNKISQRAHACQGVSRPRVVFLHLLVSPIFEKCPRFRSRANRHDRLDSVRYSRSRQYCGRLDDWSYDPPRLAEFDGTENRVWFVRIADDL